MDQKTGVCLIMLIITLIAVGFASMYFMGEIAALNKKLADSKPDVAKPIYCDDQNTCYVLQAWMNIKDANQSAPYNFHVVKQGMSVESVSISDIRGI